MYLLKMMFVYIKY